MRLLLVNDPTSSLEIWGDGCPGSYPAAPQAVAFLSFPQSRKSSQPCQDAPNSETLHPTRSWLWVFSLGLWGVVFH